MIKCPRPGFDESYTAGVGYLAQPLCIHGNIWAYPKQLPGDYINYISVLTFMLIGEGV